MTSDIYMSWSRLENYLLPAHPDRRLDELLLPPASDSDLRRLQQELGVTLPHDYLASLRVHTGTVYWVWLWDAVSLGSPGRVLEDWRAQLSPRSTGDEPLRPDPGVRSQICNRLWIPIADDNGIPICLDLDPDVSTGGRPGQVILVDLEDGRVRHLADTFAHWFAAGVDKLTAE